MSAPRKSPRPAVTANFALTWDARVSTRNHTPSDFSSPRDKRRLLEIRATGDAVLAGAGTIAADSMTMGMPAEDLRAERLARGQAEYPLRVVITNSGKLNPALRLFETPGAPLHIFSTSRMPAKVRKALADKATLHLSETPTVDLAGMLGTLRREYGVKKLVCEGGPTLFRSMLEAGFIDDLFLTLCPRIFGGEEAPTLSGVAGTFFPQSTALTLRSMEVVEGECFLHYRVLH